MPALGQLVARGRERLAGRHRWHVLPVACVCVTLLLCGYLRFVNLDWGFGAKVGAGGHPDEIIIAGVVQNLAANHFDTDLALAPIPQELKSARYNFSSYEYSSYLWYSALSPVLLHTPLFKRAGLFGLVPFFVSARTFSACLGLLACLLSYWCARFIISRPFALLAALFTGVLPLLVQDSHYARTESFVTAGALGVIGMSFLIAAGNRSRSLLVWCPLVLGFLIASKVSLAALLYLPLYAVWRAHGSPPALAGKWKRFAVVIAACALGFLMGVPYVVPHWRIWWQGWRFLKNQYSHPFPPHGPDPAGYCFAFIDNYFWQTFGAALLLLACIGIFRLLRKRDYSALVFLVSPVAVCYVIFGLQEAFLERNVSHVAPLVAILAAAGCAELWGHIASIKMRTDARFAAITLLVAACLWVPLSISWRIAVKHFGGQQYDASSFYDALTRAVYGVPLFVDDLYFIQSLERIQARLNTNPGGYILRLRDANDLTSRHRLSVARHIFSMRLLATQPSEFSDLPTSTLQVYLSSNYSWYLVRPNSQ